MQLKKESMKKLLNLFLLGLVFANHSAFAQVGAEVKADSDTKKWRYEVQAIGEGKEGTYLVKVWTYSKKANIAIEQAKKNAIHGVIFQGLIGVGVVSGQPPLATDPGLEVSKADFFNDFFRDNGPYMKYVSVSGDGSVAPGDAMKVGKEYKVGVVVSVRKDLLKSDLINAGIIRSLNSGF